MKNRYNRRVTIDGIQYDSKFEYKLMSETRFGLAAKYHSIKVPYEVRSNHTYEPDFIMEVGGTTYYYEAKGRFNFRHDLHKYLHIKNSLTPFEELIFIFEKPKTPLPGAKKRKDGTRMSNADWADKHGFRWTTLENVDEFIKTI